MAGKYDRIVLANIVNEFPAERIDDLRVRESYKKALDQEREEAEKFIKVVNESKIPDLFNKNCKASIEVKYMSAKDFADSIDVSEKRKDYLKRYF